MAGVEPPMLAVANTGAGGRQPIDPRRLLATGDWIADLKLDGMRAQVTPDGRIFNRKLVEVTHKFPELDLTSEHLIDGEIVALDGTFESTLLRESQESKVKITRLAESHPTAFVAFDLPAYGQSPWWQRRELLQHVMGEAVTPTSSKPEFVDAVRERGGEGVILKRVASRYQPGKRSSDWVKVKNTIRVSAIAYGYSPGHGSRDHFGALTLAMLDGTTVVPVGRTGSGFTVKQTHDLQARLDRGEWFVVEVETLGFTSGRQLRFPVFRGIRTDVDITSCTIDQIP